MVVNNLIHKIKAKKQQYKQKKGLESQPKRNKKKPWDWTMKKTKKRFIKGKEKLTIDKEITKMSLKNPGQQSNEL